MAADKKTLDAIARVTARCLQEIKDEYNLTTNSDTIVMLSAMQSVIGKEYRKVMGDVDTAMFFYAVADKIIEEKTNKELKRKGYKGPWT